MNIPQLLFYLFFAALLLLAAYLVFRKIVRRDCLNKGKLSWPASLSQLLVFVALMCFPYLFLPPEWPWFYDFSGAAKAWYFYLGFVLIIFGFIFAFGTMFWFGLRRAFGLQTAGLIETGPYRFSRNPQIIGGYLLVFGVAVQWLSLYSLGWVMLYGIIGHLMIATEEECLSKHYGAAYDQYKTRVPRYIQILDHH